MKVLVINSGSSSLKYQLINVVTREVLAKGNCERVGTDHGIFKHTAGENTIYHECIAIPDHDAAMAEHPGRRRFRRNRRGTAGFRVENLEKKPGGQG